MAFDFHFGVLCSLTDFRDLGVDWVDGDDPGIIAVWFSTPMGPVRVD